MKRVITIKVLDRKGKLKEINDTVMCFVEEVEEESIFEIEGRISFIDYPEKIYFKSGERIEIEEEFEDGSTLTNYLDFYDR